MQPETLQTILELAGDYLNRRNALLQAAQSSEPGTNDFLALQVQVSAAYTTLTQGCGGDAVLINAALDGARSVLRIRERMQMIRQADAMPYHANGGWPGQG